MYKEGKLSSGERDSLARGTRDAASARTPSTRGVSRNHRAKAKSAFGERRAKEGAHELPSPFLSSGDVKFFLLSQKQQRLTASVK